MAFQFPAAIHTVTISSPPGTVIYYPQVIGLPNRSVQQHINRTIQHAVSDLQQQQKKVQTGTVTEMTGHYEIKTNERGILSLTLSNYAYSQHMAHGFTVVKSLTFDIYTGRLYRLSDLFKPGSNYIAVLSGLIEEQIKQRDLPLLNGFTTIKPDQDYYLADKSLVVYFQLYEITPYYAGFPMFPISDYLLLPIAATGGPLDILSADIA